MHLVKRIAMGITICLTTATAFASSAHAFAYFAAGAEIAGAAKEAITPVGLGSRIKTKINGFKVIFECTDKLEGQFEKVGESSLTLTFETCRKPIYPEKGKLKEAAGCTVKVPFKWSIHDQLVEPNKAALEDELTFPAAGAVLEFQLEGAACEIPAGKKIAGKYKLEGSQLCEIEGVSFEEAVHGFDCTSSGSKLKLKKEAAAAEPADLVTSLAGISLKSGKAWYAE